MVVWTIERLTSLASIDAVLAIEDATFTNPWTRAMYAAEFDNPQVSRIYVARPGSAPAVGFCACWLIADELHINNLAVLPGYRRSGAATALLEHVLREAGRGGAVRATLEVRRSNEVARQLYRRFKFADVGVRPGYYTRPVEDAIILSRDGLAPVEP
jgi:ribosomal-protein-alanine N-acetyltransferase